MKNNWSLWNNPPPKKKLGKKLKRLEIRERIETSKNT